MAWNEQRRVRLEAVAGGGKDNGLCPSFAAIEFRLPGSRALDAQTVVYLCCMMQKCGKLKFKWAKH